MSVHFPDPSICRDVRGWIARELRLTDGIGDLSDPGAEATVMERLASPSAVALSRDLLVANDYHRCRSLQIGIAVPFSVRVGGPRSGQVSRALPRPALPAPCGACGREQLAARTPSADARDAHAASVVARF